MTNPSDPHRLQRFVDAQAGVFDQVCSELGGGRKRTHWIWFIFPQLKGLGSSSAATYYGIVSLEEARAYLMHPILGARLERVTRLVLDQYPHSPYEVLGSPDDLKFCSSMTLFVRASGCDSIFQKALDKLFGGKEDARTLALLEKLSP